MRITYGSELILDLQGCNPEFFTEEKITQFLVELCQLIDMKRYGDPVFWHDYSNTPHLKGVSAMQFISTSNIVFHGLDYLKTALINIFSCKDFDIDLATNFSKNFFCAQHISHRVINRKTISCDNPKLILKNHKKLGKGVFATEKIFQGEIIAVYDGKTYTAESASLLPNTEPLYVQDHVMQFAKNKYRDSKGVARYINHSCNPNCGIRDLFKIVAMRNISPAEEITWDYDMTENSDWSMHCNCESANCRKHIKGFRFLPKKFKDKYRGYISDWLSK